MRRCRRRTREIAVKLKKPRFEGSLTKDIASEATIVLTMAKVKTLVLQNRKNPSQNHDVLAGDIALAIISENQRVTAKGPAMLNRAKPGA